MLGNVNEMNAGAYYSQKNIIFKKLDVTGGLRADYFNNHYDNKLTSQTLSANSIMLSPNLILIIV